MTKTTVPPRVHQTLNVLMRPIAFVPIVLIMPENMFTAHAIAVISTLVKVLPCPTSAMDERYRATLWQILGYSSMIKRISPQIPGTTSKYHGHGIKPASEDYFIEPLRTGWTSRLTTKDRHVLFHFANPEVESSHCGATRRPKAYARQATNNLLTMHCKSPQDLTR